MPDRLVWTPAAWSDYVYLQSQDRKTLSRINALLLDTMRSPFNCIGKPEPLKESHSGFWSRRVDDTNRLVYSIAGSELATIACRCHYDR